MNRRVRLAVMLLGPVLVAGVSCARWRKDESGWGCCDDAETCIAVLQDVDGPDPGVKHDELPQAQNCATIQASLQGPSIIPRLVPLLKHADSRVRHGAASALGAMGRMGKNRERATSAVPALIEAAERELRGAALRALISIDDARALPLLRQHIAELPGSTFSEVGPNVAGMMLDVLGDPGASQKELRHIHEAVTQGHPRSLEGPEFGLDEAILFPRLRVLLRRELDEPVLRRPPDAVCPAAPARSCTPIFDGCTPRAAYVVSLIESLMVRPREEAWEEVRQAFQRGDPRLTPVALDALAHFKSPEAVKPLVQELSIRECQLHALRGIERVGPVARSEAMAPLVALIESNEEGWTRALAARLITSLGEEEAYGPLRRALEAGHSELQAVAVENLRVPAFWKHSAELLPLLTKLEEESSSPLVRREARGSMAWLQAGKPEAEQEQLIAVSEKLQGLEAARRDGGASPSRWRRPTLTPREGG